MTLDDLLLAQTGLSYHKVYEYKMSVVHWQNLTNPNKSKQ